MGTQPLIEDGVVYFVQDGYLYLKAYTLSDGKKLWGKRTGKPNYGRKLLESGNKIFLDEDLTVQAHRKSDGAMIWETWITDNAAEISGIGSPVMSQDETYLYAGRKGYVVKLRKSDGQVIRRYPLDRLVPEGVTQGCTEPVISPYGDGILYVPTSYYDRTTPGKEEFGANLFAFDASMGVIKWSTKVQYKIR